MFIAKKPGHPVPRAGICRTAPSTRRVSRRTRSTCNRLRTLPYGDSAVTGQGVLFALPTRPVVVGKEGLRTNTVRRYRLDDSNLGETIKCVLHVEQEQHGCYLVV
ncbi:hypothetical protein MRX96_050317 [Rhipicephalus microplus]